MRILAKTQAARYSPVIAVLLALAILALIGERAMVRGAADAARAVPIAMSRLRADAEPAVVTGGILVSRNRHIIAGAGMGCGLGAAVGAGSAALLGLVTGGLGFAAAAPAAAFGCAVGGAAGIAVGYPLDSWALTD
ncbi:MAG TPA: hypothetical protein VN668_00105 [Stellaceae bacterium]|nr:hypothetical protein [Stellaceae bacterium]